VGQRARKGQQASQLTLHVPFTPAGRPAPSRRLPAARRCKGFDSLQAPTVGGGRERQAMPARATADADRRPARCVPARVPATEALA